MTGAAGGPLARLAALITDTAYADLPDATTRKATIHLLDTLGAGLAGARSEETRISLSVLGAEAGPVPVWGTGVCLSPRAAALVNAVSSHAYEVDDTGGCDHSGAVVVPAALAAAAACATPVSGTRLLTAIVLGYDVGRRILEALGGYEPHNGAGWHSTGTCGPFAAAAAAAHVLGLTPQQTESALGLAASGSAGLWAFVHDGAMSKRLHAGRAAEAGLLSAQLALRGMTGPSAVLDDVWGGLLSTYAANDADPDALTSGLGTQWKIMRSSIKPYASCRGTHSSIDALSAIMADHRLDAADITAVFVRLSHFLHGMCGGRDIRTLAGAQLSLPYALAARLAHGHAGLDAYDEDKRGEESVRAAMDRIALDIDETMPPTEEPVVTAITTTGARHQRRVHHAGGSPANPLPETAIRAKFRSLAGRTLPDARARAVESAALGVAELEDVREMGVAVRVVS
ncbi:MmgE/PrpD family protein [Streptomyces iranensis]|uniref:MmgE/PrpD family protein n=1 Tax=Streptomyces iranensis TaxID=576784 RepID=UPI0039B75498